MINFILLIIWKFFLHIELQKYLTKRLKIILEELVILYKAIRRPSMEICVPAFMFFIRFASKNRFMCFS